MQSPRPDLDAVLASLTARERQIVDYVAAGRPNKVIAIDLGISLRTAEAHRARIFAKLDARNAMQLACRLCAHGRSGASPILGALPAPAGSAPAGSAPGRPGYVPNAHGVAARTVHEPGRAYTPCQRAPQPPDPDA